MCKGKLSLIVLLWGLSATCMILEAQILNIEQGRLETDSGKAFHMKANLGFQIFNRSAAVDDPVNLLGLDMGLNTIYEPGRHAYIFIGQTNYLEINDAPWLNFGFMHARVNFIREEKLSYELYSQYSYDNFRGLDPRLLIGGNLRWRLLDRNQEHWVMGLGGMYESERWMHPTLEEWVTVQFLKVSTYFSFRKSWEELFDLNAIAYYQTGYDAGIEDLRHRYNLDVRLNTRFSERWSMMNSLSLSYEDKPIVPITKLVFHLTVGVSVNF